MYNSKSFDALGVDGSLIEALAKLGIHTPSEYQVKILKALQKNSDLTCRLRSGLGKSLACSINLLQVVDPSKKQLPQVLYCSPSRDSACRIFYRLEKLDPPQTRSKALLVPGTNLRECVKTLQNGCNIVVGTSKRLADMYSNNFLIFDDIKLIIFDDLNQMIENEDEKYVVRILGKMPKGAKIVFLYRYAMKEIKMLEMAFLTDPTFIDDEVRYNENMMKIPKVWVNIGSTNEKIESIVETISKAVNESKVILVTVNRSETLIMLQSDLKKTRISFLALTTSNFDPSNISEVTDLSEYLQSSHTRLVLLHDISLETPLTCISVDLLIFADPPSTVKDYRISVMSMGEGEEKSVVFAVDCAKDLESTRNIVKLSEDSFNVCD